jgi:hypothetical protein
VVVTTKISLCSECGRDLNDAYLFHLWETICRHKGLFKRSYALDMLYSTCEESVKTLENKGYIITTEVNKSRIAMQPRKEYLCTNDGENSLFYCAKPELHLEACND